MRKLLWIIIGICVVVGTASVSYSWFGTEGMIVGLMTLAAMTAYWAWMKPTDGGW